jgi:hypothetical protein
VGQGFVRFRASVNEGKVVLAFSLLRADKLLIDPIEQNEMSALTLIVTEISGLQ